VAGKVAGATCEENRAREREREGGGGREGTVHLCKRPHKSAMGYST